jgi:cell division protein FtsW (lipid II flippase)
MGLFHKQEEPSADDTEVLEEETVKEPGAKYIILPLLFEMLLLGILFLKNRTASLNYLYALIPLLLLTAGIGTYVYNREGNMKLFMSAACLSALGIALQMLIDQVYHPITVFSFWKLMLGIAVAAVFILIYSYFRRFLNSAITMYVMMGVSAAIYLILIIAGTDPNGYGTSAWIRLGSYTIQLTDFTKISAVMFYASLFSPHAHRDEKQVLLISSAFFAINLIGSLAIKELGSFFILFFLHLSILYIFMKRGNKKRIYLIAVFACILLAVIMVFVLYKVMVSAAEAGTLNSIESFLWPIVRKAYQRFSVTANINLDPNGAGYQLLQGKKALWMSGLFGNQVNFNAIPVAESDMAFISLCNGFGFVFGFAAIAMFWRMMIAGSELSREYLLKNRCEAIVVYGASVLIFLQAMIVILGSCNVIPFTGLPIPFLSRGGTYQTIVFCFVGLLLHMSEKNVKEGGESDDEPRSEGTEQEPETETDGGEETSIQA